MKKKLTNNLLLKIISVIAAFLLWMVVINIDNPTIRLRYPIYRLQCRMKMR